MERVIGPLLAQVRFDFGIDHVIENALSQAGLNR